MNKTIKRTMQKYKNINDTYNYAFVGIPKGFGGRVTESFYGTLDEFYLQYPDIEITQSYPTVLYMHGSSGLYRGEVYQHYIVEELGYLFFAPNSYKIKNRPTYCSPAKLKKYMKVHRVRVAEIEYNSKRLLKSGFVDKNNLFLMGNSEGGLAVAIFKSKKFRARIVTAFSCESSYFYKNFKLGSKKSEPLLNIIGTHDEFFGENTLYNNKYKVKGNGIEKLKNYKNAKVVILPKAKHDLTKNIYVKSEILNFLQLWQEKRR